MRHDKASRNEPGQHLRYLLYDGLLGKTLNWPSVVA